MRQLLLVVGVALLPFSAHAQEPRVVLGVGASLQSQEATFTDRTAFDYNREQASAENDYRVKGGATVDLGVRVRVWRSLHVGVGANHLRRSGAAVNRFHLPHPFFFGENRLFTNESTSRDLTQTIVHLELSYPLASGGALDVAVFGGPTYVTFRQDVMDSFRPIEAYPFDTIQNIELASSTLQGSALGFHVGADVTRYLTSRLGITGLVRFVWASETLSIGDGAPFDLFLGSLQVGGGARLRF
jgi:hypothetical protein